MTITKVNNLAVVWSQPNCKYCTMAKQLLEVKGFLVEERSIGNGMWEVADLMKAVPDARSVPQIFIDGKYIPKGYEGLKEFFSD